MRITYEIINERTNELRTLTEDALRVDGPLEVVVAGRAWELCRRDESPYGVFGEGGIDFMRLDALQGM